MNRQLAEVLSRLEETKAKRSSFPSQLSSHIARQNELLLSIQTLIEDHSLAKRQRVLEENYRQSKLRLKRKNAFFANFLTEFAHVSKQSHLVGETLAGFHEYGAVTQNKK